MTPLRSVASRFVSTRSSSWSPRLASSWSPRPGSPSDRRSRPAWRPVATLVAAALTTALLAGAAAPATASVATWVAGSATPRAASVADTRGLFGAEDPQYDGVYRQAAAILGLHAVGVPVPPSAVTWLLRQQCPNGSFAAFRANPQAPCPPPDPAAFSGPDTNSTAMAAMALAALSAGRSPSGRVAQAAMRARHWLARQQLPGGGWEWIAGLRPDSTSTAMALATLSGQAPGRVLKGTRWLQRQVDVSADCGVLFQPGTNSDPLSTAWAFLSLSGPLPYNAYSGPRAPVSCTDRRVAGAGAWLESTLTAGNGTIPSAYDPAATDWNATALAALSLSQRRGSAQTMNLAVSALQANVDDYSSGTGGDRPAALGTLIMVAHATGVDPADFGGVDLPARLLATLRG